MHICAPGYNAGGGRLREKMKNLIDQLGTVKFTLPAKQKKLCDYIIENGKQVYLMSVGSLAEAAGVGRATVIRLVEGLGFSTYADFKKALNASYFVAAENHYNSNPFFWVDDEGTSVPDEKDSINACCGESMRVLQQAARELDREQFNRSVDLLISSWRVNVLGLRTSAPIAKYAYYMLGYFISDIRDLSENESLAYDWLLNAHQGEAVLMFGSMAVTATSVRLAKLCKERGIPLILITDRDDMPALPYATYRLVVPHTNSTRSTALPFIMVLEALVNEIATRMAPLSVQKMNEVNRYIIEEGIILKD